MVGPQTANREKKNPPKNEFQRLGICCRAGRIESVIVFLWDHARRLPIEYGVYTKKRNTQEPRMAGVLKWCKIVPPSCTL